MTTTVWRYPGKAAWYFASVPKNIADDIKTQFEEYKRGWGSFKVEATIGETTWKTSIFPDKETGGFLLPIKAEIRELNHISADDKIDLLLEILT